MKSMVIGGTGRLGNAVAERLQARGDQVFQFGRVIEILPNPINYVIFCQRYRGEDCFGGEFHASATITNDIIKQVKFDPYDDCAVVVVSSVYGVAPGLGAASYSAGKAAQISVALYHAQTLGTRVNIVSPWAFTREDPPIKMSEVVDVIEFMASNKSKGINGQNVLVDRGQRARWAL